MNRQFWASAASLAFFVAPCVQAQEASVYGAPDPAGLTMPRLDFVPTPDDALNYDKYFYFHREDTSFVQAYDDIRECDALSSGSNIYAGGDSATVMAAAAPYGVLAGGVGAAIGAAAADAIWGSAQRRAQRRTSMRNCMGFKAYHRYPLSDSLWKAFNFEEGFGRKKEDVRLEALALQALVASGPKPTTEELAQ